MVVMVTMATVVMVTKKMLTSFKRGMFSWFMHTIKSMITRIIIDRKLEFSRVYIYLKNAHF